MGKHLDYQKRILPILRRGTSLPETAPIEQVVKELLNIGEKMEAVELLFATNRDNDFFIQDGIGWAVFMDCIIADNSLIVEISNNHQWSTDNMTKGFTMQIYPNEWFTILEPTATKIL